MSQPVERVEVELDDSTARWVQNCADRRGVSTAALIAEQLRQLREREVDEILDAAEAERWAAVYSTIYA